MLCTSKMLRQFLFQRWCRPGWKLRFYILMLLPEIIFRCVTSSLCVLVKCVLRVMSQIIHYIVINTLIVLWYYKSIKIKLMKIFSDIPPMDTCHSFIHLVLLISFNEQLVYMQTIYYVLGSLGQKVRGRLR